MSVNIEVHNHSPRTAHEKAVEILLITIIGQLAVIMLVLGWSL